MENDGKNLVEDLMLFVEHFDEKNSKMEKVDRCNTRIPLNN